jgi:hypothetical protein
MLVLKTDVEMYCADPRKYSVGNNGPTPIESNTVTITNAGNTKSTNFEILITGDIEGTSGPLLIELTNGSSPSQTMRLLVPTLPASAPALSPFPTELGIDFFNTTMNDEDGNNCYYLRDLTTPWLVLLPGDNVITFTPESGEVDGNVTWNDAWI